jgi:hypothetical protein
MAWDEDLTVWLSVLDGSAGRTNFVLLPYGGGNGSGGTPSLGGSSPSDFLRSEWSEMEAQRQEDLLAGLGASGTTGFLFEDPIAVAPEPWLVDMV